MDWLYAQYIYQAFGKEDCFSAIMKGSLRYLHSFSFISAIFQSSATQFEKFRCVSLTATGNRTVTTWTCTSRTSSLQRTPFRFSSVPKAPRSRRKATSARSGMRRRWTVPVWRSNRQDRMKISICCCRARRVLRI